jgi:hypothetical protein
MTSEVAAHEAGHVLVGLKTGRKLLRVWVRGRLPFSHQLAAIARQFTGTRMARLHRLR